MDWGLIVGILVFVECLVVLKGLLELNRQIEEGLDDLSADLAAALQKVKDDFNLGGGADQPTPIQQALAQILINSVNPQQQAPPASIIEAVRDEGGKFLKKD